MLVKLRHIIARMIALPNREFYKDEQEAALSDYENAHAVEDIFDFSNDLIESSSLWQMRLGYRFVATLLIVS